MSNRRNKSKKNTPGKVGQKSSKNRTPEVNTEKNVEKDIFLSPGTSQSEFKGQSDWKSKVEKWAPIAVLILILCYLIPCVFKAVFAIVGYSQPTLDNYISSIDRPLAWASLVLAIVSLYNGSKNDKAAAETTKLIQDMQGVITGLNWKIDATNAMLKGMYTAKSGTGKASESPDIAPEAGWGVDSVRKVEADLYTSHAAKGT